MANIPHTYAFHQGRHNACGIYRMNLWKDVSVQRPTEWLVTMTTTDSVWSLLIWPRQGRPKDRFTLPLFTLVQYGSFPLMVWTLCTNLMAGESHTFHSSPRRACQLATSGFGRVCLPLAWRSCPSCHWSDAPAVTLFPGTKKAPTASLRALWAKGEHSVSPVIGRLWEMPALI